jgi:ankyrin repeat protein
MYAVLYEQEDCVRSLLEHGADVNLLDAFLSTPIMLAVCTKNRSIVTLLQEAGADLDQKNKAGESVREQAERVGLEL